LANSGFARRAWNLAGRFIMPAIGAISANASSVTTLTGVAFWALWAKARARTLAGARLV
jgi:hypothetical protein